MKACVTVLIALLSVCSPLAVHATVEPGATTNCPSAQDCVSVYGFCGQTADYCAPGNCKAGPCWATEDAAPLVANATAPPVTTAPVKASVIVDAAGGRWCTVTENFDTLNGSIFGVDYCPSHVLLNRNPTSPVGATSTLTLKMDRECGTRLSSRRSYQEGYVEARVRAASGNGVVTAFILQSNPMETADELDWEWVGREPNLALTNVFVNGVLDHTRGGGHPAASAMTTFHTYGMEWNQRYVRWFLDGQEVRRLDNNGMSAFPVKPMHVKLGIWDGTNTGGWAGTVDFSQAPFYAEFDYVKIMWKCNGEQL